MADFHQEGLITTLHPLYQSFDREEIWKTWKRAEEYYIYLCISPITSIFIAEYRILRNRDPIMDNIQKVRYLTQCGGGIGGAPKKPNSGRPKEYSGGSNAESGAKVVGRAELSAGLQGD